MPSDTVEGLAIKCLLENTSYRLTRSEAHDPLVGFRILWRTIKRLGSSNTGGARRLTKGDRSCAIFNSYSQKEKEVTEYYQQMADPPPGWYLTKEHLPGQLSLRSSLISLLPFGIRRAFSCLFTSKSRGNRALEIHIVTEIAALLQFCKLEGIKQLMDHAPYLIDSNFQYQLLRSTPVHYTKVPSPGPLKAHHSIIQTDRLITTSGYHEEELRLGNLQVSAEQVESWIPEASLGYILNYYSKPPSSAKGVIGFYSHAGWLRKESNHSDDGLCIPETELDILYQLREYLNSRKDMHLLVFPHPRETSSAIWPRTRVFYQEVLGSNDRWGFYEGSNSSVLSFHAANIGVAAYSTIIYERLFAGFKMLIGNSHTPQFPLKESNLNNICFKDADSLEVLLERAARLSTGEFFEELNLQNYHHLSKKNILNLLQQRQEEEIEY